MTEIIKKNHNLQNTPLEFVVLSIAPLCSMSEVMLRDRTWIIPCNKKAL